MQAPVTGWTIIGTSKKKVYLMVQYQTRKNMDWHQLRCRQDRWLQFGITNNGLIGGVVFVNAQSFSNYPGNEFDAVWPGYGLGIRIKANKNSNTNIGIDYGFGLGNSRGLFVNLGELF